MHHCSFLICSSIMQFWAGCPFTIIRSGSIYSHSEQFCHKGFPDHWLLAAQKWCFYLASFFGDIFLWSVTRLDECRYLYFVSNHVFLLPKSHYCSNEKCIHANEMLWSAATQQRWVWPSHLMLNVNSWRISSSISSRSLSSNAHHWSSSLSQCGDGAMWTCSAPTAWSNGRWKRGAHRSAFVESLNFETRGREQTP